MDQIREVRTGKGHMGLEARKLDPNNCFSITYGDEFNLKVIGVAGKLHYYLLMLVYLL